MVAIAIEVATRVVRRTGRFAKAMRAAIRDGRSLVDTSRNKKKAKKAKTAKKGKPKKTRKAKKEKLEPHPSQIRKRNLSR